MVESEVGARLLRGASVLGRLHAKEEAGKCGWAVECACGEPAPWCKAKALWVKLAVEDGRKVEGELWQTFTKEELAEAKLTVTLDIPGLGHVKVGPKGDLPWDAVDKVGGEAETLRAVLMILRNFPGSKVL